MHLKIDVLLLCANNEDFEEKVIALLERNTQVYVKPKVEKRKKLNHTQFKCKQKFIPTGLYLFQLNIKSGLCFLYKLVGFLK